jgi:hypothetical protein
VHADILLNLFFDLLFHQVDLNTETVRLGLVLCELMPLPCNHLILLSELLPERDI